MERIIRKQKSCLTDCNEGWAWHAAIYSRTCKRSSDHPVCLVKNSAQPHKGAEKAPTGKNAMDLKKSGNSSLLPESELRFHFAVLIVVIAILAALDDTVVPVDSSCVKKADEDLPGFNDWAALKPKIAEEGHQILNGALKSEDVTLGSKLESGGGAVKRKEPVKRKTMHGSVHASVSVRLK